MTPLLIYSGGLDSTVALYLLRSQGHDVACLSFDYGQRHGKELIAAVSICEQLNVSHTVIDLTTISGLFVGSSLTSDLPVPQGHYEAENMKATVVPNRNMVMLALAGAMAISGGRDAVVYAAHSGDHAIYPDCRSEFIEAMRTAFGLCDWSELELVAPFHEMTKADIVRVGVKLGVPFDKTWSCYNGRQLHCGLCGTCVERREAFQLTGAPDPTRYES